MFYVSKQNKQGVTPVTKDCHVPVWHSQVTEEESIKTIILGESVYTCRRDVRVCDTCVCVDVSLTGP